MIFMLDDDIICTCMSVSVKDIKHAIAAGAKNFSEVQEKTGIGTVCGVCNDEAETIIARLLLETGTSN